MTHRTPSSSAAARTQIRWMEARDSLDRVQDAASEASYRASKAAADTYHRVVDGN
jgi:hypothetical protein